jgi:hypothetical protein
VRHVSDTSLRRLVDEPFAVADEAAQHMVGCGRCQARHDQIASNATLAARVLSRPRVEQDVDLAWNRLQDLLADYSRSFEQVRVGLFRPRRWHLSFGSYRLRVAVVLLALVVAGTGILGVLTTGSPATRQPESQSVSSAIGKITSLVGIERSGAGPFGTPSGSVSLPFGNLTWVSDGRAHQVNSIAQASQSSGLDLRLASAPPSGVGLPDDFVVQPSVTATISFTAAAGRALNGSSLTVTAGPAVLIEYGNSVADAGLPTLLIAAMEQPRASAQKASSAQLESFVLTRRGIPRAFTDEIRLLEYLSNVTRLRLPPLSGVSVTSVEIGANPGVLVTDGSGIASGVVWEDGAGVVHAALGLLDKEDILGVANQLG